MNQNPKNKNHLQMCYLTTIEPRKSTNLMQKTTKTTIVFYVSDVYLKNLVYFIK